MTNLQQPPRLGFVLLHIVRGGLMGLIGVGVTRAVYFIEDGFEKLPIHWMWWPALGGSGSRHRGDGWLPIHSASAYYNIRDILSHNLTVGSDPPFSAR